MTELEFAPGLNVIQGKNSSGKTAVFRAIRLLAYNRPTRGVDESMIRRGKSQCVIKAAMSDGSWVIREKGKDVNRYVVSSPLVRGGQVELNNFGQSVPPEVSLALGFGPLKLAKTDGIELNISSQGEGTFMLSETDPEIARWMYALTSLNDVRGAIDSLTVDHKRVGQSLKFRAERVADLERQLLGFEGLDRRNVDLQGIESDADDLGPRMEAIATLEEILSDMVGLRDRAVPVRDRAKLMKDIIEVLSDETLGRIEADVRSIAELSAIDSDLGRIAPRKLALEAAIKVNAKLCKVDLSGLDAAATSLSGLTSLSAEIDVLQSKVNAASDRVTRQRDVVRKLNEDYEEAKAEMFSSEDGDKCPMCGAEVDSDAIDHIIEEHA
jgi:DNA repair exonuclease SbcCD ATPase subunit